MKTYLYLAFCLCLCAPVFSVENIPNLVDVKEDGATLDLGEHLLTNQITVVDFYAEWCGPCRAIKPELRTLALENEDINVVQVDIVKWSSPVAEQYDLKSIPNLRVYLPDGTQVGKDGSSMGLVKLNVKKARRLLSPPAE